MKISGPIKELLGRVNIVYVSTSGKDGVPHLAAGERISASDDEHVKLEAWFCVRTVENLMANPHIAMAVIDSPTREGFQLTGTVERIEDKRMMDGYVPDLEEKWAGLSTTEYTIDVVITHVLRFSAGVHSDLPLAD